MLDFRERPSCSEGLRDLDDREKMRRIPEAPFSLLVVEDGLAASSTTMAFARGDRDELGCCGEVARSLPAGLLVPFGEGARSLEGRRSPGELGVSSATFTRTQPSDLVGELADARESATCSVEVFLGEGARPYEAASLLL